MKFATRLNSMKDRESVLSQESSGVEGWIKEQGKIAGLGLVDLNYPQHFTGPLTEMERDELSRTLAETGLKCGAVCLR